MVLKWLFVQKSDDQTGERSKRILGPKKRVPRESLLESASSIKAELLEYVSQAGTTQQWRSASQALEMLRSFPSFCNLYRIKLKPIKIKRRIAATEAFFGKRGEAFARFTVIRFSSRRYFDGLQFLATLLLGERCLWKNGEPYVMIGNA
jgi:hypothetical protein